MPDQPLLDISHLETWFGFRPGMTRTEVLERAKALGAELVSDDDETATATVNDQELEFTFAIDGSERLRQLAMMDDVSWGGTPLTDAKIDDALRAMGACGTGMWEANDSIGYPFPLRDRTAALAVSDEQLLEEGTIWFPARGLGIVISDGEVTGVAWRASQDLPSQFAGPVTDAQREVSKREDIEDYLWKTRRARNRTITVKGPLGWLRTVWTVAILAALALVGRTGFRDVRAWAAAPVITGRLIGVERGPLKQFFEYLPPGVTRYIPGSILSGRIFGKRPETDIYRVEYHDPSGRLEQARLESAEFYVPPHQTGEEVPITYLAGNPPRVKGPARVRDAAFLDYVPWAICLGGLYVFGQFLIGLLPLLRRLLPLLRGLVPKATIDDSDRQELR